VLSPRRIASYKLWYQVKGNLNHATVKSKEVRNGYHTYLESLIPGKIYHVTIKPMGTDGKAIAKYFGSTIECSTPEAGNDDYYDITAVFKNMRPPQTKFTTCCLQWTAVNQTESFYSQQNCRLDQMFSISNH